MADALALSWSGGKDSALALLDAAPAGHAAVAAAHDLRRGERHDPAPRRRARPRARAGSRRRVAAGTDRDPARGRERDVRGPAANGVRDAAARRRRRGRVRRPVPRRPAPLPRGAPGRGRRARPVPAVGERHARARAHVRRRRVPRRGRVGRRRPAGAASTSGASSTTRCWTRSRPASIRAARTASTTRSCTTARSTTARSAGALPYPERMDPEHARELLARERPGSSARSRARARRRRRGALRRDQNSADTGTEQFETESEEGIAEHLATQLEAIERAEKRLEEGTYGLSIESGEPIPDGRLERSRGPSGPPTSRSAGSGEADACKDAAWNIARSATRT